MRRLSRNLKAICYVGSKNGPAVAGTAQIITDKADLARQQKSHDCESYRITIHLFDAGSARVVAAHFGRRLRTTWLEIRVRDRVHHIAQEAVERFVSHELE